MQVVRLALGAAVLMRDPAERALDWLDKVDHYPGGEALDPGAVTAFLQTIDCYVMGSRTHETALRYEAQGAGWAYGEKPTFGISFFAALDRDVALHLRDVKAYRNGMVELRYEVQRQPSGGSDPGPARPS